MFYTGDSKLGFDPEKIGFMVKKKKETNLISLPSAVYLYFSHCGIELNYHMYVYIHAQSPRYGARYCVRCAGRDSPKRKCCVSDEQQSDAYTPVGDRIA